MKYAWIQEQSADYCVTLLCAVLSVTRSAYYAWVKAVQTHKAKQEAELKSVITAAFTKNRAVYGTRRLKKVLEKQGYTASRRRIGRIMQEAQLRCKTKRRFKATTNSKHTLPVAPNQLDRQFNVNKPDQAYVGDITYIHTQQGWLYLAVVIDLYSRQIVGWSMAEHMKTTLVNDALIMAIWKRKPAKDLLWHTDRGSQYASDSHRKLLKQHGITQSMSRKGNCWDNAVSESFFHTLKTECVNHENYSTREAARKSIFDYIEVFYNRQRLHSSNGYLSPVEFERQFKAA
ncbi:MAG: IS3 family transposase [Methylococcaceae bacterium]|nr:IS3 family transposase [Methylococcaceae bacterium]